MARYQPKPYDETVVAERDRLETELTAANHQIVDMLKPVIEEVLHEYHATGLEWVSTQKIDLRVSRRIKAIYGQTVKVTIRDVEATLAEMKTDGWLVQGADRVVGWGEVWAGRWCLLDEHQCHCTAVNLELVYQAEGSRDVYRCVTCGQGWSRNDRGFPDWLRVKLVTTEA